MKMLFLLVPILAMAQVIEPKEGQVKFQATASPGALAIRGSGQLPSGKLNLQELPAGFEVSGVFDLKLDTFTTGISLRDSHMKNKYLEVEKFPEASLTLPKQVLPKSGAAPFEGELTLHGVKHAVKGSAELQKDANGGLIVKANFPVKLQDHAIAIPSFAGISVANEVGVETEFRTK